MQFIKGLITAVLIILLVIQTVSAASFAEKFKAFILGPEVPEYLLESGVARLDVSTKSFAEKFKEFIFGPEAQAYPLESGATGPGDTGQGCMGCHNGVKATNITVKDAEVPMQVRGFQTVNHPVGMYYDDYAQKDPLGYKPRSSLAQEIQLVDDKVTCIACHRLRTDEPQQLALVQVDQEGRDESCTALKQLTVGSKESDLCLACHIK
ncbi:MAG: hypothetical protein V3S33_04745 [Gammaproteobacteria bacterium]